MPTNSAPALLHSSTSPALLRVAWRVVILLWPIALLNYLDRQILASMKYSVMAGVSGISTEAQWGILLAQF